MFSNASPWIVSKSWIWHLVLGWKGVGLDVLLLEGGQCTFPQLCTALVDYVGWVNKRKRHWFPLRCLRQINQAHLGLRWQGRCLARWRAQGSWWRSRHGICPWEMSYLVLKNGAPSAKGCHLTVAVRAAVEQAVCCGGGCRTERKQVGRLPDNTHALHLTFERAVICWWRIYASALKFLL